MSNEFLPDESTSSWWSNHSEQFDKVKGLFTKLDDNSYASIDSIASNLVPNHNQLLEKLGTLSSSDMDEKQLIIVFLLAQLCANHDPTPKLFIVNCLHFHKIGLLKNVHFLCDLGFLPQSFLANHPTPSPPGLSSHAKPSMQRSVSTVSLGTTATGANSASFFFESNQIFNADVDGFSAAMIPAPGGLNSPSTASGPAAKIRTPTLTSLMSGHLIGFEGTGTPSAEDPSGFMNFKLSRYQREFHELELVGSGGFGSVAKARHKLDGIVYAVKRVPFTNKGFAALIKRKVMREVYSLAKLDHPNVCRYYSSWLEPTWLRPSRSPDKAHIAANRESDVVEEILEPSERVYQSKIVNVHESASQSSLSVYDEWYHDDASNPSMFDWESENGDVRVVVEEEEETWDVRQTVTPRHRHIHHKHRSRSQSPRRTIVQPLSSVSVVHRCEKVTCVSLSNESNALLLLDPLHHKAENTDCPTCHAHRLKPWKSIPEEEVINNASDTETDASSFGGFVLGSPSRAYKRGSATSDAASSTASRETGTSCGSPVTSFTKRTFGLSISSDGSVHERLTQKTLRTVRVHAQNSSSARELGAHGIHHGGRTVELDGVKGEGDGRVEALDQADCGGGAEPDQDTAVEEGGNESNVTDQRQAISSAQRDDDNSSESEESSDVGDDSSGESEESSDQDNNSADASDKSSDNNDDDTWSDNNVDPGDGDVEPALRHKHDFPTSQEGEETPVHSVPSRRDSSLEEPLDYNNALSVHTGLDFRYLVTLYIQTKYYPGPTLFVWFADRISRWRDEYPDAPGSSDRVVQFSQAVLFFQQLVSGLAHIHERGIIHRDLKPQNLFMCEQQVLRIGDFGLAKLLGGGDGVEQVPSTEGYLDLEMNGELTKGLGTPSYASPEQLGDGQYTVATDMFSLGLVAMELFVIFETGMERAQAFAAARKQQLPEAFVKDKPEWAGLIASLLSADPSERPTARELLESQVLFPRSAEELVLQQKNRQIEQQQEEIEDLRRRLQKLQGS